MTLLWQLESLLPIWVCAFVWCVLPMFSEIPNLASNLRSVFTFTLQSCKIVYAHENFFDANHFVEIKSVLEVRQKCGYLAGQIANRDSEEKRVRTLKKLELEHRRLQRKV